MIAIIILIFTLSASRSKIESKSGMAKLFHLKCQFLYWLPGAENGEVVCEISRKKCCDQLVMSVQGRAWKG